jgi:hypothetical protein
MSLAGKFKFRRKCTIASFVQLAFNLSNGVTDTIESSTMLVYLVQVKGIFTHKFALIKTGN